MQSFLTAAGLRERDAADGWVHQYVGKSRINLPSQITATMDTSQKQPQAQYFDALHGALCLAVDCLMEPLLRNDSTLAESDKQFLIHAERFAAQCSTACAA